MTNKTLHALAFSLICVAGIAGELDTNLQIVPLFNDGTTLEPATTEDTPAALSRQVWEHAASGSEWRTVPLWSIGLTAGVSGGEAYLHDGRAQSLEEAIHWHSGEAESG
jgi:hypothetical protein